MKTLRCLFLVPLLGAAASAQISFQGSQNLPTQGLRPDGIDALDFDRDGDNDLAIATGQLQGVNGPEWVELMLNTGGVLTQGPQIFVGNNVGSGELVAADLDGDLDIDIAVTLHNTNSVQILLNNGGTFGPGQSIPLAASDPRDIAAGDLDRDGDVDLITSNRGSDNLRVLLNNGSGVFAVGALLSVGSDPRDLAIGDLDGDDLLDVAVAAHDSRRIDFFLNTGSGAFGALHSIPAMFNEKPSGMLAADLDADGDVDLVTTLENNNAGLVVVMANSGAATFSSTSFASNGLNPGALTAADLDRDGRLDLAAADEDSNVVSVLRNNGGLAFGPAQTLATGTQPDSIVAADLDGNGSADLATSNELGNNVTVLRNSLAGGPVVYCTSGTSSTGCSASISASANPRVDHATDCRITVTNVPGQRMGLVFYGRTRSIQPWCTMGGGTSFLCLSNPKARGIVQSSGGAAGQCNGTITLDWSAFQLDRPLSLGTPWNAGDKVYVQGWYRDPAACRTTQLSNAVELTYQP